jgi:uncharacterized spore protein YtfJ
MTSPSPIPEFFKSLHEPLAAAGAVQRVFGEPVQSGQRTVIPVARVSWGFGGGSGRNLGPRKVEEGQKEERRPPGEGGGGGGGIQIKPLGVYEITPEGTRFISPVAPVRLLLAGSAGLLLGWWLARR